jgi:dCMP deaminase
MTDGELMDTREYLRIAYRTSSLYSDDPRTQNGAVLVPVNDQPIVGVNRLPDGVKKWAGRLERPAKYKWIEHAERVAILKAACQGVATEGATLYCPWFACPDCARAIIFAGITKVIGHRQAMDRKLWADDIEIGNTMLDEHGVIREYFDGPVFDKDNYTIIRFDGQLWTP